MATYNYIPVTILNGQTDSLPTNLWGQTLVGIRFPAAMTGTAVTVLESDDVGGTYNPVNLSSVATAYPVILSTTAAIPAVNTACVRFARIRSGSSEGGDRIITLITRIVD